MKVEQFTALFPKMPFIARYVYRDSRGGWGWHVKFCSDHFTSDTDRLVDSHDCHVLEDGWGETLEQALEQLAERMECSLEGKLRSGQEDLRRAEEELASFRQRKGS